LLTRALAAIRGLHEPLIMIWLGTCDLTQKIDRGFISLNSSVEIGDIMGNFRDFQTKIKSVNKTAEIIFLQCPIYSIKLWNKHKRHPDYEASSADDKTLETKVEILNNEFSKLNAGTDGPKFSLDLLNCSRVRTVRNKRKLKSKYIFNMKDLYNDGIHPNPLLAHLWLRKIQEIVLDKCF
jgi:hypothetical protein